MILEHILLLPYMHDNRTVISVLKTDNPSLSGLYYHVGCSQYYMTMELTHQSHSPITEKVLQARASDGILCKLTVLQYWHHAFMEQVHLME